MYVYLSTVFADTYIRTVCTSFTVDDVIGSLHLYNGWGILFKICGKKAVEDILYSGLIHRKHLLPKQNQTDYEFP